MAKTVQKRIRFNKGEINPLLSERSDTDLLGSSASYIKNYVPTIFGGIKTRKGTKYIDIVRNIINSIENPIITSFIGGSEENFFNDELYTSDVLGEQTKLFQIKALDNTNNFIRFSINGIYLAPHKDSDLNFTLDSYTEQNTNSILSFELEEKTEETTTETEEETETITYYQLKSININVAGGKYFTTPIITFTKNNLGDDEILPEATAILENGVLNGVTINNRGHLNSNDGLEITITQPEPTTTYYYLKSVNINIAGNNYKETPTITFTKTNLEEGEVLPQATAILENNILKSITIDNGGKLYNDDGLILTIEQPEDFQTKLIFKNDSGESLNSFLIDETTKNITLSFPSYQNHITIEREDNNNLNTKLNITKFSFNTNAPTINTTIGGDIGVNISNYESDIIGDITGELLHFTFEENVNFFTLNGLQLKDMREVVLRTQIYKYKNDPDDYNYWLNNIVIDDAGTGYKNGVHDVIFTANNYYGFDRMPQATATVENFTVKKININYVGIKYTHLSSLQHDDYLIKASLPLYGTSSENNFLDLKLQALTSNGDWEDIKTLTLKQGDEKTNINEILDTDGFKEFRLIRTNTQNITTTLLLDNISYGNYGGFVTNSKFLAFNYNNINYLLSLSAGSIQIYKDDIYVNSLQATVIKESNLKELKYTQIENKIVITHSDFEPLVVRVNDDGIWFLEKLNLINIPYADFGDTEQKTITNITLTPSAANGTIKITASGDFFNEESEGQIIDGNGGRVRITDYHDAKTVFGYTIIPFYTDTAFTNFKYITGYEPVWSEKRGYPICCSYFQQRLWFGGSKKKPLGLWASRVGYPNDFKNIGNYDNDAINIEIASQTNGKIVNIYGNRGLQIFTENGEYIVNEGSLTPNNIYVNQTSNVGTSLKLDVHNIAGTTLFVDKKGFNLNTFIYSDTVANYTTQAITVLNNNLLKEPVAFDIDYNSASKDGNYIFVVNGDGTIMVGNILLEQNITAFTRFEMEGGKICDVKVVDNDVYFLVLRNEYLFIEKLTYSKTDFTQQKNIVSGVINDLNYFKGKVHIYNDEKDYGVFECNNGYIDLNDTNINDTIFVGIDINCCLISNDIMVNNQSTNIKTRLTKATLTADENTKEIIFNKIKYKSNSVLDDNIFNMYGVSNYEIKNRFTIESRFEPVNIKSILLDINYGK